MWHSLPPFASRFHSPNKRLYHPRLLAKQEGGGYVDFREVTHGPSCRFISRLLPAATQFSYQPLIPEAQFPRTPLLGSSRMTPRRCRVRPGGAWGGAGWIGGKGRLPEDVAEAVWRGLKDGYEEVDSGRVRDSSCAVCGARSLRCLELWHEKVVESFWSS